MRIRTHFLRIAPVRALIEACLIGMVIVVLLAMQTDTVNSFVMGNGLLFLCGMSALWPALRAALPYGSWRQQAAWEMRFAIALSIVLTIGLPGMAILLGWSKLWPDAGWAKPGNLAFFLCFVPGSLYVAGRVALRFLLRWDHMRRTRMLWALTHTQLSLVVLGVLAVTGWYAVSTLMQSFNPEHAQGRLFAALTEWLLRTLFPTVSVISVMTVGVLLLLLPPAALFSFWIARRVTGRLETLAAAARSFRQGHYDTRVAIAGEDEVAQLQADFNAMAADLEQSLHALQAERDKVAALLQSQQQLVAGVSHELRTPLSIMRGYLETSLSRWSEQASPDVQRDLHAVEAEAVRLQGLIDDLFTVARAGAGGLPLEIRPTDAGAVITQRVAALAPLAWQSGRVEATADVAPDLPNVLADEGRLAQIVSNLLHNAVRHTMPGGIVVVSAVADDPSILIQVRDTGEGIDPADLPHIWTRFYQSRSSHGGAGGAGLGLALVKDLCEEMGGTVAVESTLGQGSCFTVRLPQA